MVSSSNRARLRSYFGISLKEFSASKVFHLNLSVVRFMSVLTLVSDLMNNVVAIFAIVFFVLASRRRCVEDEYDSFLLSML